MAPRLAHPGFRLSDRGWLLVVGSFVVLQATDLALTEQLMDRGAVELNPLMASLFELGWATIVKGVVTAAVAAGLWWGRHHRLVRRTGVGFLVLLATVVVYQVVNLAVA